MTYCIRHKDVETNIACGRCGDPICARCLVHAPVGVRCPDCGRSRPAPTFDVSPVFVMRGIGAGIGAAALCAVGLVVVEWLLGIPYVTALLVAVFGLVIGEAVSLSTNRKRGPRLKVIAGVCVALSFLGAATVIASVSGVAVIDLFSLLGLAAAVCESGFSVAATPTPVGKSTSCSRTRTTNSSEWSRMPPRSALGTNPREYG